ncbi:MAG TPA: hypothetical protein VFC92_03980 [Bacteroidales bacterium]|nr:hypothetical protein [Bacteroidales bacterium]
MDIKELKPTEIFSGTAWQADQIRNMLMDNEIEAYLGDEIWGMDAPNEESQSIGGGVSVYVGKDDLGDARVVVDRYYQKDASDDYS